jgi:hypothetical protein
MDKKCGVLVNAVTIVSGLVFNLMTKKWPEIQEEQILYKDIGDEAVITEKLEFLLSIYEEVARRVGPTTKNLMNAQWKVGNFTAYIIYSLNTYPAERERLKEGWVNWLAKYRRTTFILGTELHADVGAARSWNETRWRKGYMRVFDPTNPDLHRLPASVANDDDDDDDESEE